MPEEALPNTTANNDQERTSAADDLARTMSFEAKYGSGTDRALVFGGGGLYFIAWQIAYIGGLAKRGVNLGNAELIVGTSAGSVVAGIVGGGHLKRFAVQLNLLAKVPALISAMAPAGDLHPSQLHATQLFRAATDARPDTIREIGRAALAAQAAPAAKIQRSLATVMAAKKWPESLRITTVDCYTGERLIISGEHGVPLTRAAAASSSVPGLFAPQPINDRRCMDGGVSGSGLHCDVVAGTKRALVISLAANVTSNESMMTIAANSGEVELASLAGAGTEAIMRGPQSFKLEELMSADAVPKALAQGEAQAEADATELSVFWN